MPVHTPVLTKEVLEYLDPKPGENFIDGTVGEGGHAILLLEKTSPDGKLLGIDLDSDQINNCSEKIKQFAERAVLVNDSYANIKKIIEREKFSPNGILLDLGMSSWQLEGSEKGFSFQKDQKLDMRYDLNTNELTAGEIVNEWPEPQIEEILREYGEEKFSRQIAKKICEEREAEKIETTFQLLEIVGSAVPERFKRGKIHYATRTFQALRIAVNSELENIKKALPEIISVLSPGGRAVIISFHSLEDRIVKNFFRDKAKEGTVKLLTKKPVTAGTEEIEQNPRSRSAKLRAIEKIT